MSDNIYRHPSVTWTRQQCARLAKRVCSDAYGTKDPMPGLLHMDFGLHAYNGGCIRDGKHYDAEYIPLPIVPEPYAIVHEPYWGYRIVKQ